MAIPAAILTIFLAVNAHTTWGYWHQTDGFRRAQRSWSTFIKKRWLLVLFFNRPAFLVAPHDRGKPGGLELRRRYRERR